MPRLPTAGQARAWSGLSTLDFLRFFTWQEATDAGAESLAQDVIRLADAEGLPGHAAAARIRGGRPEASRTGAGEEGVR